MPENNWDNMDYKGDWIIKTLCGKYYKWSDKKCKRINPFFVPRCEDILSESCSPPGEYEACTEKDFYEDLEHVRCTCQSNLPGYGGVKCEYTKYDEKNQTGNAQIVSR